MRELTPETKSLLYSICMLLISVTAICTLGLIPGIMASASVAKAANTGEV